MKNAGMAGAVALVGIGRVVPPCSDRLRLVATSCDQISRGRGAFGLIGCLEAALRHLDCGIHVEKSV